MALQVRTRDVFVTLPQIFCERSEGPSLNIFAAVNCFDFLVYLLSSGYFDDSDPMFWRACDFRSSFVIRKNVH